MAKKKREYDPSEHEQASLRGDFPWRLADWPQGTRILHRRHLRSKSPWTDIREGKSRASRVAAFGRRAFSAERQVAAFLRVGGNEDLHHRIDGGRHVAPAQAGARGPVDDKGRGVRAPSVARENLSARRKHRPAPVRRAPKRNVQACLSAGAPYDGGRSASALPKFSLGLSPIVKLSVPPATSSACEIQLFVQGLPFQVTDWM